MPQSDTQVKSYVQHERSALLEMQDKVRHNRRQQFLKDGQIRIQQRTSGMKKDKKQPAGVIRRLFFNEIKRRYGFPARFMV